MSIEVEAVWNCFFCDAELLRFQGIWDLSKDIHVNDLYCENCDESVNIFTLWKLGRMLLQKGSDEIIGDKAGK